MHRDSSIDLLKAMAVMGVVVIHTTAGRLTTQIGSLPWYAALLGNALCRAAVPVFLMCSGMLFFDPERELTIRRLFTRYIPRILSVLCLWSLIYRLSHTAGHLYYLQILLLFYTSVPLVRVFVRHASRKELWYALGFWFLLGILLPTVKRVFPMGGIPGQWAMNMTYAAIGYGLLGYALKRKPLKYGVLLFSAGLVLTFGLTVYCSLRKQLLCTTFLEGMSVGPALMAAGITSALSGVSRVPRFFSCVSEHSLGIFLVHVFFLGRVDGVLVFVCSYLAAVLLSKIPYAKRWLI